MKEMHKQESQYERFDPVAQRYLRDPEFHALVDLLESFIHRAKFSATELREAALLATIRYENLRPQRAIIYYPDGRIEYEPER